MTWLSTVRLVTFVTITVFAIIVMSLSADLIALTEPNYYFKFAALALATSLLTLFTVTPMFVIDTLRKGAIFSYVIVEIVWLTVIWILWLSSGSYAAWTDGQLINVIPEESSCNYGVLGDGRIVTGCQEIKAIMAFSFLSWILLMAYTGILLVLGIRAQEQGNHIWKTSVGDGVLFYPGTKSTGTPAQVSAAPVSIPQTYPPVSHHSIPASVSRPPTAPGSGQV